MRDRMKYIIFLVVITIVIVAYVKFDKSDNPSSNNKSDEIFSDSWIDHNQVIWENNESEDIVGCPLPSDISKLSCHAGFFSDLEMSGEGVGIKSNWLVAEISFGEFQTLVKKLGLSNVPNLTKIWPEVFECVPEFSDKWCITNSADKNTFFGEDSDRKSLVMLKYEGGKIFARRSTYYEIKIDNNKQIWLKVITKM